MSILQGVAQIFQGDATANAYKAEGQIRSDELKRDAEYTKIAAQQSQAGALDELQRTVGTIRATLSSRNLDLSSPSSGALEDASDTYAKRNIMRGNFNAQQQIGQDLLAARTAVTMASFKAKVARNAGYMAGASSFFQSATQAASLGAK